MIAGHPNLSWLWQNPQIISLLLIPDATGCLKLPVRWKHDCCMKNPHSKVYGANMGPTGPRWAPGGPPEPCYLGKLDFDKPNHLATLCTFSMIISLTSSTTKQRVLMHGHQGWNVRHGLCHIYMIYVYIWVVYSFCLFCCLFIIVTTQFVALYKPCKPKPKPSTYDPPDNHPLAEIQRPILRPEPKQQICHQHANTDHFGK